jgi:hypothetical protein
VKKNVKKKIMRINDTGYEFFEFDYFDLDLMDIIGFGDVDIDLADYDFSDIDEEWGYIDYDFL